jgi:hypothetical protein
MAPLVLAACLLGPGAAAAGDDEASPLLVLTAGRFNIKHPEDGPFGGGIEYRWAPLGRWKLIPGVGFTAGGGGVAYGYASLRYDFRLGRSWVLTPVFGAGAFNASQDVDLGYGLEFKSGLELTYRTPGGYRAGLLVYHLSNGGLSERNPGTEVLELVFGIPLGGR